jgi:hypothetical protein
MMPRRAGSFERVSKNLKPYPTVLIVCEDTKSSKTYFEEACQTLRVNASVKVVHSGRTDPIGIVSYCVNHIKKYEQVYCVFDRDEHQNFDDALKQLADNASVVAFVSYPCFEYWLLLHQGRTRKPYSRSGDKSPADCLLEDLKRHPRFANYSKGDASGLFNMLFPSLDIARQNAEWALNAASNERSLNPSTKVHKLIDILLHLGNEY